MKVLAALVNEWDGRTLHPRMLQTGDAQYRELSLTEDGFLRIEGYNRLPELVPMQHVYRLVLQGDE